MRFAKEIRAGVFWLLAVALGLLGLGFAMDRAGSAHLRAEAEHAALQWARFVRQSIPDLDRAFVAGAFSPDAVDGLSHLRQVGDVFRFKLWDAEGRQLLASDDIVAPAAGAGGRFTVRPSAPAASADVRELLLGARSRVELKRESHADWPPIYSEAYVPVLKDGKPLGMVQVYVDQTARAERVAHSFRSVALAVTGIVVVLFAVGFWQSLVKLRQQRRIEERVRYMAHHDALTGVLNRTSFNEALAEAERRAQNGGGGFAVLCIDLDRFKEVNDALGHAAGDEALCEVAGRLQMAVRQFDLVARVGGDEFAVLQTGVRRSEDVTTLAQRIVESLAQPYDVAGQRVPGGVSVGAAIYGNDGCDKEQLLHKADLALYRAKAQGRGQFSFYDADTDEKLQSRRGMVHDLRDALRQNGLSVHFQPLYERDGATLSGYEALARWTHPTHGPVSPMVFIPLAEEAGLIEELGEWVLMRACSEAASWPGSLELSVNLSAAQFRGDLVETVARCLRAGPLPARRLHLEITESLLINNTDSVLKTLHGLTGMGVRIAMDDFGTGYSSLAYLWRFPFDKLKIDRAFTQNLEEDPKVDLIVRSIISLAHSMGIRVNAEGVETPSQMARLQAHGCDELQGFLLGRPVAADRLRHVGARDDEQPERLPRALTDFGGLTTLPMPL
jgi:diguanylate cyclase (GGDEF)-like protein